MRVFFDHQIFAFQNYGGISRYFVEVINKLHKYPDVTLKFPTLFSNNEYLTDNKVIKSTPFLRNYNLKGKGTLMMKLDTALTRLAMRKNDYDVFHPTYYHPYHLGVNKKPTVVTCYDLIHEIYIQDDKRSLDMKKRVLERADKIFAISKHTKSDLIKFYNIPEERVEVVYLANSLEPTSTPSFIPAHKKNRYLLYVGNRNLYKNFTVFLKAIAPILHKSKDLYLFCAGGGKFNKEEHELFNALKIESQVEQYSGSNDSLYTLYSNAIAFIYPSLYEGFGIPLLEAMSCGCPVLASNTSSLPEVGSDAALYFEPKDEESIRFAVERLISDTQLQNDLKRKGAERVKEFTWEKTALQSHALYKKLIG
jgi:glycosyltransferase involved in cell wall biosynthesis